MAKRDRRKHSTEDAPSAEAEEKPDPNSPMEWVKSFAVAFLLFIFLKTFILQTFVITSGSMEDTLLVGDMLLVNRVAMGSRVPGTQLRIPGYDAPERGDVLVFDPHHEDDLMLIKRLIGLPGDTLEMRNRVLYLNGEILDEPYVRHTPVGDQMDPRMRWQHAHVTSDVDVENYRPSRDTWGPVVVPEGYYFMLGDNREASLDSRYWGLLEQWRIEGRAVLKYFSYNKGSPNAFPALREIRWGRIGRPIN